jgi:hypothetical protein
LVVEEGLLKFKFVGSASYSFLDAIGNTAFLAFFGVLILMSKIYLN